MKASDEALHLIRENSNLINHKVNMNYMLHMDIQHRENSEGFMCLYIILYYVIYCKIYLQNIHLKAV